MIGQSWCISQTIQSYATDKMMSPTNVSKLLPYFYVQIVVGLQVKPSKEKLSGGY